MEKLIDVNGFTCIKPNDKEDYHEVLLGLMDNGYRVYNKCEHHLELTDGEKIINLIIPKDKEVQQ